MMSTGYALPTGHPASQPSNRWWLLPLLGLLLAIVAYILLPALGINAFTNALGLKRLILLWGAAVGGIAYLYYLRFILIRPQLLVAFILLAWPLVEFGSTLLLDIGINLHMRPLLIVSIALPSLWVSAKHVKLLLHEVPWFKYYLAFMGWLVLYAVFFNANAADPGTVVSEGASMEHSLSLNQLLSYFYCLLGLSLSAIVILKARDYQGLFDSLNKGLIVISSLEALMTIMGYPFGMFNQLLDGFTRAIGIFSHPNPFAHHMGVLMVYLLGLYCYYQGERKLRMPSFLLFSGLVLNFIALLLGLSKTAIAVFLLCAGILALMNLAVPAVRKRLFQSLIGIAILIPIGLFVFEALSGQSFFKLIESRIDQTDSLTWRVMIWQDLMAGITPETIWFGHGFTAANEMVLLLSFDDSQNAHPLVMVHNAYIALLYDLGVMGYLMFAAAASLILHAILGWLKAASPVLRTEHSIIFALAVYFLFVCGFDEMAYMFDAPMLCWMLVTMLFCVNRRDHQHAQHPTNPATRRPVQL